MNFLGNTCWTQKLHILHVNFQCKKMLCKIVRYDKVTNIDD